jgi:nitroimidazol reductase NimA-like FMN-containing flavoprotein (pyridoxamine 5'-phosphate oxidase superfamily)
MRIPKGFKRFLLRAQVMRFASLNKNGFPHVVPVCPLFYENRIYFVTDIGTVKLGNISRTPKVAAVFDHYEPSWRGLKGIMIQGTTKIIRRGELFYKLRDQLYKKFPPYKKNSPFDVGESVIVEITPRKGFSWAE